MLFGKNIFQIYVYFMLHNKKCYTPNSYKTSKPASHATGTKYSCKDIA